MVKSWKIRIGNGFVHPSKHFPKDKSSEIKEMGQITREYPGYIRVFLFYFLNATLSRSEGEDPKNQQLSSSGAPPVRGVFSLLGKQKMKSSSDLQSEVSFALVTRKHSPCSMSNSFLCHFTFG